jgi:hypothetical protein
MKQAVRKWDWVFMAPRDDAMGWLRDGAQAFYNCSRTFATNPERFLSAYMPTRDAVQTISAQLTQSKSASHPHNVCGKIPSVPVKACLSMTDFKACANTHMPVEV